MFFSVREGNSHGSRGLRDLKGRRVMRMIYERTEVRGFKRGSVTVERYADETLDPIFAFPGAKNFWKVRIFTKWIDQ
ncbi:hypothetical protein TNCV_5049321 [Trichonephila clavipes]|nr:hypothetical protein TNCV_5049321 [Trichonephila clavipes]